MRHAIKIIESERLLSRFGHMRNKIEAINLSSILTLTFYKTSLYSSHVPKVKFIIENIFQLKWQFDLVLFINLSVAIGLITLLLIVFTNLKYLSPKVYPLVRNE